MSISFYPDNDSYTVGEIVQAMLHLGFDGEQVENLINRLREKNGNPSERTADDKYVNTLVSESCYPVDFVDKCDSCRNYQPIEPK